jgi:hypothetical protein
VLGPTRVRISLSFAVAFFASLRAVEERVRNDDRGKFVGNPVAGHFPVWAGGDICPGHPGACAPLSAARSGWRLVTTIGGGFSIMLRARLLCRPEVMSVDWRIVNHWEPARRARRPGSYCGFFASCEYWSAITLYSLTWSL